MTYTNPENLLKFNRFDIPAKYLFLEHLEKGYDTDFGLNVYINHIGVWNGFKEYDNADKSSPPAYVGMFKSISESIKEEGYDPKLPPVPVSKETGYLLNGSHSLASCLYHNKQINYEETDDPRAGQADCTSYFFRNQGLDNKVCDAMAIQYAKMKKNTY